MAEVTVKTIQELAPNLPGSNVRLVFVRGTSANNNDTLQVTNLTSVIGAFLISTTGTVITMTFSGNTITLTNGGTLIVTGMAWGL